jgi:nitroreductase
MLRRHACMAGILPLWSPLTMQNEFLALITTRHCKRAFLDRSVPRGTLENVLRAAAHAPSSRNNQPWQVAVLSGAAREGLALKLCEAFDSGIAPKADYVNRPALLPPEVQARTQAAGSGVFRAKGIAREDDAARRAHQRDNLRFYGAPVALIFHLPADAVAGTFLEMGFFLQNVMLGLVACGLASCPQYSVASYSDIIRAHLGIGPDRLIVCGMSVGYMDERAPINQFIPERLSLEQYTQWFDH